MWEVICDTGDHPECGSSAPTMPDNQPSCQALRTTQWITTTTTLVRARLVADAVDQAGTQGGGNTDYKNCTDITKHAMEHS